MGGQSRLDLDVQRELLTARQKNMLIKLRAQRVQRIWLVKLVFQSIVQKRNLYHINEIIVNIADFTRITWRQGKDFD